MIPAGSDVSVPPRMPVTCEAVIVMPDCSM